MTTLVDAPKPDFRRDRYNRPLIVPASGGKAKPYTRASAAAKVIEDRYNLELWGNRNIAFGLSTDASLVARILAIGGTPHAWDQDTKKAVNQICDDASKVALSHKAADIGTALHRMIERINHGETVEGGMYQADLDAYRQAIADIGWWIDPAFVECQMACDELEMAGTCDLIVGMDDDAEQLFIADLKTGTSIDFGGLGYSAQLAAYAHSDLYDVTNDTRTKLDIDRTVGYIVHLPAGQGICTIHTVDLAAGYQAALLANKVRRIRRESKHWIRPIAAALPPVQQPAVSDAGDSPSDTATSDMWEPACLRFAQTLKGWAPDRQAMLRSRWPVGVPTPTKIITGDARWDHQHVWDIVSLLDDLELPFVDTPFTATAVDAPAVETDPTPVIDEGGPLDLAELDALLAAIRADPCRDTLNAWLKEAADRGNTWSPRTRRTVRAYEITRAAMALAHIDDIVAVDTMLDAAAGGSTHKQRGVILGDLTIDQARTLQQMCDAYSVAA
jgi:hypothetical protein